MSAIFHFCPLPCVCGYLHFHVNIYLPSITFDIIFSTYSRHIPYRLYSYQTFQRYVYSVSIHFHYCANSQCTKVEKIALITWPVRGVLHIVSWAVFTSPHFHRFLLNEIAKIGENGGSRDNHAYTACKIQGVAQD